MSHQIDVNTLVGETFESLLASSASKRGLKRLILRTTIERERYVRVFSSTLFVVQETDEDGEMQELVHTVDLKVAVDLYNKSLV